MAAETQALNRAANGAEVVDVPFGHEAARPVALGARAWIVLAVLAFVYVLNFLDRQLLSILAKPIQDSLHVTDGQLGRIGGLYFALFYCLISIPVGWLADRTNRVRVLSLACALWSVATMACGLSANYSQLVASRMAVGVGEAGGVPPSYAIISELLPSAARRGTALRRSTTSVRRSVRRWGWRSGPPWLRPTDGGEALRRAGCSWDSPSRPAVTGDRGARAAARRARQRRRTGDPRRPRGQGAASCADGARLLRLGAPWCWRRSAAGRDADRDLRGGQLHHAAAHAGEGHDAAGRLAIWYALVVAVGMGGGIFASGPGDRPLHAGAARIGLRAGPPPSPWRFADPAVYAGLHLGAAVAAGDWCCCWGRPC